MIGTSTTSSAAFLGGLRFAHNLNLWGPAPTRFCRASKFHNAPAGKLVGPDGIELNPELLLLTQIGVKRLEAAIAERRGAFGSDEKPRKIGRMSKRFALAPTYAREVTNRRAFKESRRIELDSARLMVTFDGPIGKGEPLMTVDHICEELDAWRRVQRDVKVGPDLPTSLNLNKPALVNLISPMRRAIFAAGKSPRDVAPAPSTPLYSIKSGDGGFVVVVTRAASSDTEDAGIAPATTALFALRSLASLPVANERVSPATPPAPPTPPAEEESLADLGRRTLRLF